MIEIGPRGYVAGADTGVDFPYGADVRYFGKTFSVPQAVVDGMQTAADATAALLEWAAGAEALQRPCIKDGGVWDPVPGAGLELYVTVDVESDAVMIHCRSAYRPRQLAPAGAHQGQESASSG